MSAHAKDYTGERFGLWTAVSFAGWTPRHNRRSAKWLMHCDCGAEAVLNVEHVRGRAVAGKTPSCGCARASHGHARDRSPTYRSWQSMVSRCTNPSDPAFAHYQSRGIGVCDRWRVFTNFLSDMGERPDGMTLDRIDNDGGYAPGNCRWATKREQANNRITNKVFQYRGQSYTLAELARHTGTSKEVLRTRLMRCTTREWTVEDAVHTPRMWKNGKLR